MPGWKLAPHEAALENLQIDPITEGGEFRTYYGQPDKLRYKEWGINAVADGEIVGSVVYRVQPKAILIESLFVDAGFRTENVLLPMLHPLLKYGLPLDGYMLDDRLKQVWEKWLDRRYPDYTARWELKETPTYLSKKGFLLVSADVNELAKTMVERLLGREDIQKLRERDPGTVGLVRYQALSRLLDRMVIRVPEAYKLYPWLVREWKQGRVPDLRENHGHLADILQQATRHLEYLRAHPNERVPDVNHFTWDQLQQWVYGRNAAGVSIDRGPTWDTPHVLWEWEDGWKLVQLETPHDLKLEGEIMGHCVGGYHPSVSAGISVILSLRDPKGQPHVTMEVTGQEGGFKPFASDQHNANPSKSVMVVQIQGTANTEPKPEYQERIREFIANEKANTGVPWVWENEGSDYSNVTSLWELEEWYDDYREHPERYDEKNEGETDEYGIEFAHVKFYAQLELLADEMIEDAKRDGHVSNAAIDAFNEACSVLNDHGYHHQASEAMERWIDEREEELRDQWIEQLDEQRAEAEANDEEYVEPDEPDFNEQARGEVPDALDSLTSYLSHVKRSNTMPQGEMFHQGWTAGFSYSRADLLGELEQAQHILKSAMGYRSDEFFWRGFLMGSEAGYKHNNALDFTQEMLMYPRHVSKTAAEFGEGVPQARNARERAKQRLIGTPYEHQAGQILDRLPDDFWRMFEWLALRFKRGDLPSWIEFYKKEIAPVWGGGPRIPDPVWMGQVSFLLETGFQLIEDARRRGQAPDIMAMSWDDFLNWKDSEYNRLMQAKPMWESDTPIYTFGNGYYIAPVSLADAKTEADIMGHCLGQPDKIMAIETGNAEAYSLRDPDHIPHATIWFQGGRLDQVRGTANTNPKGEYKSMVEEWLPYFAKQRPDLVIDVNSINYEDPNFHPAVDAPPYEEEDEGDDNDF